MKVFATTAISQTVGTYLPLFKKLAGQDRFRVHRLTENPDSADAILFLDGHQHYRDISLRAISEHPLVRQNRRKALIYSELDQPWCAMPGLYVSMPKRSFDWRRQRACSYLLLLNTFVAADDNESVTPSLLFSYMGRRCHPVRDRILKLRHQRAHIEDTTAIDFFGDSSDEVIRHKHRYASVIRNSKFVLCPRGGGLASFRLFETMAAGRVPVIISNGWVPPLGPVWDQATIRVKESQVKHVASIVESYESAFESMSQAARSAWEQWFAPDVIFHRMIESCAEILSNHTGRETPWPRLLNSRYLYLMARSLKWRLKEQVTKAVREVEVPRGSSRSIEHSDAIQ